MWFFDFATRVITIQDKFFNSLRDSEWIWTIDDSKYEKRMIVVLKEDGQSFTFHKDSSWSTTQYRQLIKPQPWVQEIICELDSSLYYKLESLAEERVLMQETERAGGYILDDDLRQAIINTKKVMNAGQQIEMLTEYIKSIRSKYPTTNSAW